MENQNKTLRELVDGASSDISIYKNPNVRECQEKLNEVLVEAGLNGIMNDQLVSLNEYDGDLYIGTKWVLRGCSDESHQKLPSFVIDAVDPMKAAKLWGLDNRINLAKNLVNQTRTQLLHAEEQLLTLRAKKLALSSSSNKDNSFT